MTSREKITFNRFYSLPRQVYLPRMTHLHLRLTSPMEIRMPKFMLEFFNLLSAGTQSQFDVLNMSILRYFIEMAIHNPYFELNS